MAIAWYQTGIMSQKRVPDGSLSCRVASTVSAPQAISAAASAASLGRQRVNTPVEIRAATPAAASVQMYHWAGTGSRHSFQPRIQAATVPARMGAGSVDISALPLDRG